MKKSKVRQWAKVVMIVIQLLIFIPLMKLIGETTRDIVIGFGIFLILNFSKNMYSFKSYLFWEELKRQLRVHVEMTGILLLLSAAEGEVSNLLTYPVMMAVYFGMNILVLRGIRRAFRGILEKRLVIIGTGRAAKHLAETVEQNKFTMYKLMGFVDAREIMKRYSGKELKIEVPEDEILCTYKELEELLEQNQIDEVIIAKPKATAREMKRLIEGRVRKVKFIPELNSTYTFNSKAEDYDGMLLISSTGGEITPVQLKLKRGLDILAGIAGMVILGPLTLMVWKKTDQKERREGLFFRQPRIALNGGPIEIVKYRSMVTGAEKILEELMEKDPAIREEYLTNKKLKNDPRITKIGEKLRKTSLDEFPQFINVIKGEMSLIGPRPYLHREIEDMGDSYEKIIKMKPGITGMWQAHGRSDTTFDERLELDEYYYRNWSLWLDIVILIKTFKQVTKKEGAY